MNSVLEVVLTAVIIGAIGIPSPTRAALSVVMLTDPRAPWPRALGLLLGSTLVFGAVAVIGLLGRAGPGAGGATPTVNIVLGLAMIIAAIAMLFIRRRRMNNPAPSTSRHPMLSAFGVGVGVSIQSFGRLLVLLAGAYRIGVIGDSVVVVLIAAGIMLILWQAPIWGPMGLFVFDRTRFDALEKRAKPALDRIEGGIWGALIVGAVGVWMLFLGVTG